ncbi:MAG: hypothetical protein LBF40_10790 [Deltaproteobacteria bacterium]|jgi:hypothetical protein|nr:hypothetical protein [Deltaproteobacteria bacterium]
MFKKIAFIIACIAVMLIGSTRQGFCEGENNVIDTGKYGIITFEDIQDGVSMPTKKATVVIPNINSPKLIPAQLKNPSPGTDTGMGELVYQASGISLSQTHDRFGELKEVEMTIATANGAKTEKSLDSGLAPMSLVNVAVSLRAGKGSFKVVFRHFGAENLVLESKDGKEVSGNGQIFVDEEGKLPFDVTAVNAGNVVMTMKVN